MPLCRYEAGEAAAAVSAAPLLVELPAAPPGASAEEVAEAEVLVAAAGMVLCVEELLGAEEVEERWLQGKRGSWCAQMMGVPLCCRCHRG